MLVKKENVSSIGTVDGELTSDDGVFDVSPELGKRLIRSEGFKQHSESAEDTAKRNGKPAAKAAAPAKPETAAAKKKREAAEVKAAEVSPESGEVTNIDGTPSTDLTPVTNGDIAALDGETPEAAIVGESGE